MRSPEAAISRTRSWLPFLSLLMWKSLLWKRLPPHRSTATQAAMLCSKMHPLVGTGTRRTKAKYQPSMCAIKPGLTGLLSRLPEGYGGGLQVLRSTGEGKYPHDMAHARLAFDQVTQPLNDKWTPFSKQTATGMLSEIRAQPAGPQRVAACNRAAQRLWPSLQP